MAFPDSPLGIKGELLINGTWTDITTYIRGADGVNIIRGVQDQQSSLAAQTASFTLNNRDGRFSNRNPLSPYYGLLPRNTQCRFSVTPLDSYLLLPDDSTVADATTTDKAALDVVGDIDIRMEITPESWRNTEWTLAGKYVTAGEQRSWIFQLMSDGTIKLSWSTAGTFATTTSATSTVAVPVTSTRLAVRVTLDVDNGAAGKTVTFYTAPSLGGTYTQLGATVITAGITSIFSSSAALEVGSANGGGIGFVNSHRFTGKVHGFTMRSSIGGTIVASLTADTQALGATTWADGLGNTWTLAGAARISSDRARFTGEVASLPVTWDETGRDVYVPIVATGALNRLSKATSALHSPIYRNFIQYPNLTGYWPMEDDASATQAANVVSDGQPGVILDTTFTTPVGLGGSSGALTMGAANSGKAILRAKAGATTGTSTFIMYFRLATLPAGTVQLVTLAHSGTIAAWTIQVGPTGYAFSGFDNGGLVTTGSALFGAGASCLNQWIGIQLILTQVGGSLNWATTWHAVGSSTFYTDAIGGTTVAASTVGRFTAATLNTYDTAYAGAQFAHCAIFNDTVGLASTRFAQSSIGFASERAGRRAERLAAEEGVTIDLYGDLDVSEQMGAQSASKLVDLLQECAEVDSGQLYELRDILGFGFKTRQQMENGRGVILDYDSSHLSRVPQLVDDDRYTRNDVTVTRPAGSSGRVEITTGSMCVSAPPTGVGRYEVGISLNAYSDDRLQSLAGWQALIGTIDEPRIPQLDVALHRSQLVASTKLTNDVTAIEVGSPILLTDLPTFVTYDDLNMLALGYSERLDTYGWALTFNTVTATPYQAGLLTDTDRYARLDSSTTTMNATMTTTATSVTIKTPITSMRWVDTVSFAAEFPFDIRLAGEQMTVTACTVGALVASDWVQTLTVTRSVNGVVKTHAVGEFPYLWQPFYLAL